MLDFQALGNYTEAALGPGGGSINRFSRPEYGPTVFLNTRSAAIFGGFEFKILIGGVA